MQPESQALVREFNRRLRLALSHAPNHVRLEATLEVESHVEDVLRSQPDATPEPERVAQILRGFGTPEEYGRALVNQLPEVKAATVQSSAREVSLAIIDLVGGFWRLLVALLRQTFVLLGKGARALWLGGRKAATVGRAVAQTAREPAKETGRWLGRQGLSLLRILGVALRFGYRALVAALGLLWRGLQWADRLLRAGLHRLRWVPQVAINFYRWLPQATVRLYRWAMPASGRLFRWLGRTVGVAALGLLALSALGVALCAAVAPDLIGFLLYDWNRRVVEEIRMQTVYHYSIDSQVWFTHTGNVVMLISLGTGLLLASLLGLLLWHSRRRKALG